MDRLTQLRGEAGGSRDSTLDTTSPPSEAYMSANESSSKYFSLSEVDSTFDISPIKDVSLASTAEPENNITEPDPLIPNLSPIVQNNELLDYKIGSQIEAANILSGGVNIFEDNDNSYDGNELVIDDNAQITDTEEKTEVNNEDEIPYHKPEDNANEIALVDSETVSTQDTEVTLHIDGRNVDAIAIGNGLYLYRQEGQEDSLAAVQITDENGETNIKFLKVRENAEGNLEVYEEIKVEVPNDVPSREGKPKSTPNNPIKDDGEVASCSKDAEIPGNLENNECNSTIPEAEAVAHCSKDIHPPDSEQSFNGKKIKVSETLKAPVIGTYTPMAYHSTPKKEGVPLTKTMVDQQLHPSRHSDNVKKTIEVNTDSCKSKQLQVIETNVKNRETDSKKSESSPKSNLTTEINKSETGNTTDITDSEKFPCKEYTNSSEKSTKVESQIGLVSDLAVAVKNNYNVSITTVSSKSDQPNNNKETKDSVKIVSNMNKPAVKSTPDTAEDTDNTKLVICDTTVKDINNMESQIKKSTNSETMDPNINIISKASQDLGCKENHESSIEKSNVKENIIANSDQSSCSVKGINKEENLKTQHIKSKIEQDKLNENKCQDSDITNLKSSVAATHLSSESNQVNKNNEKCTVKKSESVLLQNKVVSKSEEKSTERPLDVHNKEITGFKNTKVEVNQNSKSEIVEKKDFNKTKFMSQSVNTSVKPLDTFDKNNQHQLKKDEKCNSLQVKSDTLQSNIESTGGLHSAHKIYIQEIPSVRTVGPAVKFENKPELKTPDLTANKINLKDKPAHVRNIMHVKSGPNLNKPDHALKKEVVKPVSNHDKKSINNNHAAVPFGQWTEANRQDFLNKIKETKVPINTNNQQLKQPNDLNRRDVLKKIDSQRQAHNERELKSRAQDSQKTRVKNETTVFIAKPVIQQETKTMVKPESSNIALENTKNISKVEVPSKADPEIAAKKETSRKEYNNQDLIDKTIEDIINRPNTTAPDNIKTKSTKLGSYSAYNQHYIDDIEKKMNELHGINAEKPRELPQVHHKDRKTYSRKDNEKNAAISKIPHLNSNKIQKERVESVVEIHSDDEIIEHQPVTGDMEIRENNSSSKVPLKGKLLISESSKTIKNVDSNKNDSIITENDFEKFARRNSVSYDTTISVNCSNLEKGNIGAKNESKAKVPNKYQLSPPSKPQMLPKTEEVYNKSPSKVQTAYQSALAAKRQMEGPVTIIEDKPVKIVFMESNPAFTSNMLNIQGEQLSPIKSKNADSDTSGHGTESVDSDILDAIVESKLQDESKNKIKHQRKQVLTPVETPELELIEPGDIGITVSPKKKRRIDEKIDKDIKNIVPKKSYLLGRNVNDDQDLTNHDVIKNPVTEAMNRNVLEVDNNLVSPLDKLVQAAELIENQAGSVKNINMQTSVDVQSNTPAKRGRGRPRKNPAPADTATEHTKVPSPQKKPRLAKEKQTKIDEFTDEDYTSDEDMVMENWTMGKINENIVCPICSKLFRSENVVFKHVKHCTGPSPVRSESDNVSPRRNRSSQDSETKLRESKDGEIEVDNKSSPKANIPRKSRKRSSKEELNEVIVIEDTPVKEKPKRSDEDKKDTKKVNSKIKIPQNVNNLVCEFCGKSFRQLSYLVSHRLQHKKETAPKSEDVNSKDKSIFSCEVCKKVFRKLHHLVQHRLIHNVNSNKPSRKSSGEQNESKSVKNQAVTKNCDDLTAGFRCERCDKSFRKLHHLVEHRETHDGINRQKSISTTPSTIEKTLNPPQCDVCKKTFRKLHHLVEHKEQHMETSSETSDGKSSLSTKDIIHECSLCYMVFPNEHSLNKHTIICLRKKKQSTAKQKQNEGNEQVQDITDNDKNKEQIIEKPLVVDEKDETRAENNETVTIVEKPLHIIDKPSKPANITLPEQSVDKDSQDTLSIKNTESKNNDIQTIELTHKPLEGNTPKEEVKSLVQNKTISVKETTKQKTPAKDKVAPTVTKRQRTSNLPLPIIDESNKDVIFSDNEDDDVRYMLNPNFKIDLGLDLATDLGKMFMKVRANKRNSLQIERPNSKDLMPRRTSLQHPPKLARLKSKPSEKSPSSTTINKPVKGVKATKNEVMYSEDSDDSDVKYSFPKPKVEKEFKKDDKSKVVERKLHKKNMIEKRKSLSGIAKRKSLGKPIISTQVKTVPVKTVKKRTTEIEHRCDCGELFSSGALLSRHTTLAHTPPRIRRRRSSQQDAVKTAPKSAQRNSIATNKTTDSRKSSVNHEASIARSARKSSATTTEGKSPKRKSVKPNDSGIPKAVASKTPRNVAHKGVPVPEKMRKLMAKLKK